MVSQKEQYKKAEQLMGFGFFESNVENGAYTWSDGMYSILGLTPGSSITEETFLSFLEPDARAGFKKYMADCIAQVQTEGYYRCRALVEGSAKGLSIRLEFEYDTSGRCTRRFGVVTDLTKRIQNKAPQEQNGRNGAVITDAHEIFLAVVENVDSMIAYVNSRGIYEYVNSKYCEEYKRPAHEIIGRHITDFLSPESYNASKPYIEKALTGQHINFDVPAPHLASGTIRNVQMVPRKKNGVVDGYINIVNDFSQGNIAAASFKSLIENLEQVIWVMPESIDRITYISPTFEKIWGQTSESLYNDPSGWFRVIHPDDQERVMKAFRDMPQSGFDEVYRIENQHGEIRWIHDRGYRAEIGPSHRPFLIGIAEDITERKKSEMELRRSREVFATLVSASPDYIAIVNNKFEVQYINKVQPGFRKKDLIGMSVFAPLDEYTAKKVKVHYERAFATGEIEQFELVAPNGRNSQGWYSVTAVRTNSDEGEPSLIVFFRDITEAKKSDSKLFAAKRQAEAANLAKSRFLANLSHEIRTPLNAIHGFSKLLIEENAGNEMLAPEHEDYLKSITIATKSLQRLISEILDLEKIESGKIEVENEQFNVKENLEHTVTLVAADARKKNIAIELAMAEDTPVTIVSDPTKLSQIITNLLSNSIKFAPADSKVKLDCSLQNGKLTFTVRDQGIGIPANKKRSIFDAFEQVDSSITREYGGSGLGLTIAKNLARLLGGELWFESENKHGTTFYFQLCPGLDKLTAAPENNEEKPVVETPLSGVVLIVEDNLLNCKLLVAFLKSLGLGSEVARDGHAGLEKAKQMMANGEPPSIIILDLHMPKMSGLELAAGLREDKQFDNIPLIALTADAMKEKIGEAAVAGIDDYLTKPLDLDKMEEILGYHLS